MTVKPTGQIPEENAAQITRSGAATQALWRPGSPIRRHWARSDRKFVAKGESLLRQRHKIRPGADDDFMIRNLSDIAEAASNSATVMAVLLGSIASVSLLVGGIGIMNIMLVSVTERTREIGIRMAVGARSRDIMLQFIVEAVVMAASGGVIGILVGIGSSNLIKYLAELPTLIRPDIIAISFLVSGTVGIFFGFYPARKAAQLDPIDALRYE